MSLSDALKQTPGECSMKAIRLRARGGTESLGLRGRTDTLSGAERGPGLRAFTSRPSTRFVLFINSSILQQEVHR
jgi:hypothetical protein